MTTGTQTEIPLAPAPCIRVHQRADLAARAARADSSGTAWHTDADWRDPPDVMFVCPPPTDAGPPACDCGYVGLWGSCIAYYGGFAYARLERCPGCGDVELIDGDGDKVGQWRAEAWEALT